MTRLRNLAALAAAAALLGACGDVFVNPLHNLFRPTEIISVTDALRTDASPEYLFILDTDRAQLVMVDPKLPQIIDLRPEVPGFDGVALGGQPSGMAAREDGKHIVVANFGLGVVQIVCTPIAGVDCPRSSVVATIEVGDGPERVAVAGNRAYVSRPHAGLVVSINLDTQTLDGYFDVGGQPRGLAVTKHASGDKLWVADGEGTVLHRIRLGAPNDIAAVDIGFPTDQLFASPAPQWVYAVRRDKGSLLIVEPESERLVNAYPDGPPTRGPDLELPGRVMGMGFVTYSAAEARSVGAGQFAWVSSTDGFLYALYTDGPYAHAIVNKSTPPANDAGVVVCPGADAPPPVRGVPNACPYVQSAPQFLLDTSPTTVTPEVPRLVGYENAPGYGIKLNGGRRVVRIEAWNLTYQGAIQSAAPSPVVIGAGYRVRSRDLRFGELDIDGTGEKRIRNGDLFVFTDSPVPSLDAFPADGGASPCATVELDNTGLRRRWKLTLDPASPFELTLTPADGSVQPPLALCYSQGSVSYEIRAADAWTVQGSVTGYVSRAGECPRELPDSDCAPYEYRNPFFRLVLKQGTVDSFPDMRWNFQTSDGVNQANISMNVSASLAGIPKGVAVSQRPWRRLYVVDQGDESLSVVDPGEPVLERIIR